MYPTTALTRFASASALVCAGALSACGQNPLPGAIAQAEQFDFNFVRLAADANGKYTLRMNLDTVCRDYLFSEAELVDALRTKQFVRGAVTLTFRFEAIAPCQPVGEVKFETGQLSQQFTDANGNPARRRPHGALLADVVTELSNGGVMEVAVFGIKVNGTTASRTMAAGPIDVTSAEVPSGQVGGAQGALYAHANVNPTYVEAELTNVLTNPNRFTASFAFLAKADPAAGAEALLVFDGDMVLRTDIED
jgi:hypothetical protein